MKRILFLLVATFSLHSWAESAAEEAVLTKSLNKSLFGRECVVQFDQQQLFDLAVASGFTPEQAINQSYNHFNQQQFDAALAFGATPEFAEKYAKLIFSDEPCAEL